MIAGCSASTVAGQHGDTTAMTENCAAAQSYRRLTMDGIERFEVVRPWVFMGFGLGVMVGMIISYFVWGN